jgi:hypothetical protein
MSEDEITEAASENSFDEFFELVRRVVNKTNDTPETVDEGTPCFGSGFRNFVPAEAKAGATLEWATDIGGSGGFCP